ncbi:MAG: hypothetical protein KF721_16040 [Ignavibacteriaceae bacterium]|nr:hypothetical protein [Ignavibacteriaceae bacterium]
MTRYYIIVLFLLLNRCTSEKESSDFNLRTIWITWDDWQGLYRIDSLCVESGLGIPNSKLEVSFFWAGEPIEGIIDTIKYNNDDNVASAIISYTQRPDFLKTKFAFNNPIFLPERNLPDNEIEKIIRMYLKYSVISNEIKSDINKLEEKSKIIIITRYKYIGSVSKRGNVSNILLTLQKSLQD